RGGRPRARRAPGTRDRPARRRRGLPAQAHPGGRAPPVPSGLAAAPGGPAQGRRSPRPHPGGGGPVTGPNEVLPVRRALVAVADKAGVATFAARLAGAGVEIVSTGNTAKALADAGVPVTPVAEVTGFPEMLDGRVKTLHPRIHAGILADKRKPEHLTQLQEHGIEPFDLVVINLYRFRETVASGA